MYACQSCCVCNTSNGTMNSEVLISAHQYSGNTISQSVKQHQSYSIMLIISVADMQYLPSMSMALITKCIVKSF